MELFDSTLGIAFILFFVVIMLAIAILFLLTQQNTLKAIQPQHRLISPGEVWLQLIPLFNLVWQFVVVKRIAGSIANELSSENRFSFDQQGQDSAVYLAGEKPTYNVGLAMCILGLCGIIPVLGTFASFGAIICWIIYWVQLSDYKKKIISKNYMISPPSVP
jgi:hypothetical protein